MTDTFIVKTNPNIKERSSLVVSAYFRDSSNAADTPTTIDYRIDDITTHTAITGWTSVTPAVSVNITIKSSENRIVANGNQRERRQITVASDRTTDTETRDTFEYFIDNVLGFDET